MTLIELAYKSYKAWSQDSDRNAAMCDRLLMRFGMMRSDRALFFLVANLIFLVEVFASLYP
jgi:hypothetical protein